MTQTRHFQFTPGYYEWHLTDQKGNIFHNMCDPIDDMHDEGGEFMDFDEIESLCAYDLQAASMRYADGEDYNGIQLEEILTPQEVVQASHIMATALYNYYIA